MVALTFLFLKDKDFVTAFVFKYFGLNAGSFEKRGANFKVISFTS